MLRRDKVLFYSLWAILLISLNSFGAENLQRLKPDQLSQAFAKVKTIPVWIYLDSREPFGALWEEQPLAERARQRLRRVGLQDMPAVQLVPSPVLSNQLAERVIALRRYSAILQAYSADVDERALLKVQELPYVLAIEPVGLLRKTLSPEWPMTLPKTSTGVSVSNNFTQIAMLNIPKVHQLGYTGRGVRIGLIDTGFNLGHESLQHVLSQNRLIAQYDFIHNDEDVTDEDPDDVSFAGHQSTHGTAVWGLIAGYLPGKYVGAAYDAEFVLAKTEVIASETHVEEDNFLAAIEWCDRQGVDIINVSLAYRDFDDFDYTYLDLDGKSTKVARAVNWAFQRGMLVVCAVGNDAGKYEDGGLQSPADAFGALAVGAVDTNRVICYFSSYGLTIDGRLKPDVCAQGSLNTVIASTNPTGYYSRSGTSLAAPLIAGSLALILQRYPHFTPGELIDQLKRFASHASAPAPRYGWGLPDIYRSILDSTVTEYTGLEPDNDAIVLFPNPVKNLLSVQFIWHLVQPVSEVAYFRIIDLRGAVVYERQLTASNLQRREFLTIPIENWPNGIYFAQLKSKSYDKKGKFLVIH